MRQDICALQRIFRQHLTIAVFYWRWYVRGCDRHLKTLSTIQPKFLMICTWFLQKFTLRSWRFSLMPKFNTGFLFIMRTVYGGAWIKYPPYIQARKIKNGHDFWKICSKIIGPMWVSKFPITICRTQNSNETESLSAIPIDRNSVSAL